MANKFDGPSPAISVLVFRERSGCELLLGKRSLGIDIDTLYPPEDLWVAHCSPKDEAVRIAREQAGIELSTVAEGLAVTVNGIELEREIHAPRIGVVALAREGQSLSAGWMWADLLDLPAETSSTARELIETWVRGLVGSSLPLL